MLEYSVKRLQYIVELSLQKHGKNIVEQQMLLERIADIVIDIFAMTSVLARATRAHRIGAESAGHETVLAQTFCYDSRNRIVNNVTEVLRGSSNNTERYRSIAKELCTKGQYSALHPLLK